jgi:RNA polymerase sigma-70 factor (ECF subfamily)
MMTGQSQRIEVRASPAGGAVEDDAAVIRRSRDEPEHFAVLFRRYAPEVQRYVRRRIGADAADDVLAETFLVAFGQRDGYDPGRGGARPWLYGIATNLIGRYRRSEIRQYRVLARTGRDPVAEPFTDRVDAAVSAEGARGQLAAALARLPAGHRDTLLLVVWGELSYAEAAAGQPDISSGPGSEWTAAGETGTIPVEYTDLGSLPRSPQALLHHLATLPPLRGDGPAPVREFSDIEELLATYVMPPRLTAELYRALGDVPGVTVDTHAVDVAGRTGVGFLRALPSLQGGGAEEVILSPHSYRLMGTALIGRPSPGAAPKVLNGVAYLRVALVRGPGVMP